MRLKEVNLFAQNHTAKKWQSLNSNSALQTGYLGSCAYNHYVVEEAPDKHLLKEKF